MNNTVFHYCESKSMGSFQLRYCLCQISESFEDFENGGIGFKTGPLKAALLNRISVHTQ